MLRCEEGHSFDIARQGHVNLGPGPGDSAEMVEAREAFLGAGHFARLSAAIAEEVAREFTHAEGAIVDVGAGTGHHLARVLDALPERIGVALDSQPRTAPCGPPTRAPPQSAPTCGAAAAERRHRGAILSIFAPRDPTEMARVLAAGGAVLAVTPTPRHLFELVGPLGLLSVPEDKADRLDEQRGSP